MQSSEGALKLFTGPKRGRSLPSLHSVTCRMIASVHMCSQQENSCFGRLQQQLTAVANTAQSGEAALKLCMEAILFILPFALNACLIKLFS